MMHHIFAGFILLRKSNCVLDTKHLPREFLGHWFDFWLPKSSKKYEIFSSDETKTKIVSITPKIRIFQGLRRDIFVTLNQTDPFSHQLIEKSGLTKYKKYQNVGASVFSDGTIMIIEEV